MTPRVSVLLPTHNRADVLGYAIRSILSQTVGDFELLIVGDGCTDGTAGVVRQFDDGRVRWFDLPKAPLSGYANRNIVLRRAAGDVVAYAQHDDLWFPDHLERLLAEMARTGAEWAYSRPLWVGSDRVMCPSPVNLTLPDELDTFLNAGNSVPSNCVMHRRAALDRVGYWPEDQAFVADWVCWTRMIRSGPDRTVAYCRRPTSLHFRANWRSVDSRPEQVWRPLAHEPWWPKVLICPPGAGPEQAAAWRAMSEEPGWVDRVRDAVDTAVDRMALDAITTLLPGMEDARAGRIAAEGEAARARAEVARAQAETVQAQAEADAARFACGRMAEELNNVRDAAASRVSGLEAELDRVRGTAAARVAALEAERAWIRDAGAARAAGLETERDAALDAARRAAAAAAAADAQARQDRGVVQVVLTSTTWRATAPFRAMAHGLKRAAAHVRGPFR